MLVIGSTANYAEMLVSRGRRLLFGAPATAAEKLGFESNPELLHGGRAAKAEPESNRSRERLM